MTSKAANPSALGSLGFGMTTVLFSIVNAGFFHFNAMLVGMALFLGGAGQIIAGLLSYKNKNTFGFTSYTMFGLYWLVVVTLNLFPVLNLAASSETLFMGFYFLLWTAFTVALFIRTLKMDKFTSFIFGTVVILFSFIALYTFTQIQIIGILSGWVGILCGSSAMISGFKVILDN